MKATPKRNRSDSASAAIRAAQAVALGPRQPPAHVALRPGDRPFWDGIMTARARDTWTDIDLATAGNLARTQADIERLQTDLDQQGYLTPEGKINPLAVLVETLSKRVVSLARALHVHAVASVGASEDARKVLATERNAYQDDDDLIPTLRVV